MNAQNASRPKRSIALALALTLTILAATGCCLVTPDVSERDAAAAEAIPILVTLAAEEGEALTAARTRVLERLRPAMSEDAFAAVRTYETLPIIAVAATPDVIALLLTLPDVRSVEADRTLAVVGASISRKVNQP